MALVHLNSDNFNISRRSFQVFPLSGKAGIFDSEKKKGIMCLVVSEFYGEYKRKRHASWDNLGNVLEGGICDYAGITHYISQTWRIISVIECDLLKQ